MSSHPTVIVKVSVVDNAIVCSPDPVDVGSPNSQLRFELPENGNWIFPAQNAIVVSNPGAEFPARCHRVSDWVVTLHDCNSAPGSYSYTVNVTSRSSGATLSHDPIIRNDPLNAAGQAQQQVATA